MIQGFSFRAVITALWAMQFAPLDDEIGDDHISTSRVIEYMIEEKSRDLSCTH